jgi:RNA-splicing ligase RtcB
MESLKFTGDYTDAYVMSEYVEPETLKQIYTFLNCPNFKSGKIRLMADLHKGEGSCIGFTMPLLDNVIPNVIGLDIGCSMLAYKLKGITTINFSDLDRFIKSNIPMGFCKRNMPFLSSIEKAFIRGLTDVISLTGQNERDVLHSLGTLGGGNHFIEIDKDPNGEYWVVIHTGSRNFGKRVAEYYQKLAKDTYGKLGGLEALPLNREGIEYLDSMRVAQKYAQLNRVSIAFDILSYFFELRLGDLENIETVHNYIGDDDIIRKGAVSAKLGERLLIPMNSAYGTLVCTGKGNDFWNNSAPHGAGRLLPRGLAKRTLDIENYKNAMDGIFSSSVCQGTLDESPEAYKNPEDIIKYIEDVVSVDFILKPVYNIKSGGED